MKYDYYNSLVSQCERAAKLCRYMQGNEAAQLRREGDIWRDCMHERLNTDFITPLDRRDMLALMQALGYVSCELCLLCTNKKLDCAQAVLMKSALKEALNSLVFETRGLKTKTSNAKSLRNKAYKIVSAWYNAYSSGCDRTLCDGFEAVADAILRYADALETTLTVNC